MKFPYTRKYLDRHGKPRVDYRRNGRTIPLRAPVGTPEFQAAYDAAKAHAEREQQTTRPPTTSPRILQPGTFGWLCAQYLNSPEFGQLSGRTQQARRLVLEGMMHEPIRPRSPRVFADCPLLYFVEDHVKVLRDRNKSTPKAANARLAVLNHLFVWATDKHESGITHNPARHVLKLKLPSNDPEAENTSYSHPGRPEA